MTKKPRPQDITFILVRPRYPGNIGSTARAMKNMGFSRLSLVCPAVLPQHPEAQRLAVGAADLLKKAKVFETVEQACKGLNFIVGTSRRTGKYRNDFVLLPQLSQRLPPRQKIGILFGAEERGLSNEELSFCHLVCMIPSSPQFPSLNLAQAVMVLAYQLRLSLGPLEENLDQAMKFLPGTEKNQSSQSRHLRLASTEQVEEMHRHLEKALLSIGFFVNDNSFHMMRAIRQVFGRTGLNEREVRIFRGICRQMIWKTTFP